MPAKKKTKSRRPALRPLRLLTAVPICDGHDSAISTINLEFSRRGIEMVYLGYHRGAEEIVRAAIQEDVRAVGISSYNGGHVEFFERVARSLAEQGAGHIGLFGGGGGTITAEDAAAMAGFGVDRIFFAGTSFEEMIAWLETRYRPARNRKKKGAPAEGEAGDEESADLRLARLLSGVESAGTGPAPAGRKGVRVIGFSGPGGAGKTTLIDELVRRWLKSTRAKGKKEPGRIAILSHDPSLVEGGALLGDRASMIYSQDDRVFMRSLATGGHGGGLAPTTEGCLEILTRPEWGFEVILMETAGTGQEAVPLAEGWVDRSVLVLNPDYGSTLQLQKIAMLDVADDVVINKFDRPRARTAAAEVEQRLEMAGKERTPRLHTTVASRHRDEGVDRLFQSLTTTPSS